MTMDRHEDLHWDRVEYSFLVLFITLEKLTLAKAISNQDFYKSINAFIDAQRKTPKRRIKGVVLL